MSKTFSYYWNEEEHTMTYEQRANASQKAMFITVALEAIVDEEMKVYWSVIQNELFEYAFTRVFSDLTSEDIFGLNEDGEVNEFDVGVWEEFANTTLVFNRIFQDFDKEDLQTLNDGLEDAIAYRTGINKNEVGYALAHLLNTVEKTLGDLELGSLEEIAQNLLDTVPSLSEEKIVDAYIDKTLKDKSEE